jgi:hypothetical protein
MQTAPRIRGVRSSRSIGGSLLPEGPLWKTAGGLVDARAPNPPGQGIGAGMPAAPALEGGPRPGGISPCPRRHLEPGAEVPRRGSRCRRSCPTSTKVHMSTGAGNESARGHRLRRFEWCSCARSLLRHVLVCTFGANEVRPAPDELVRGRPARSNACCPPMSKACCPPMSKACCPPMSKACCPPESIANSSRPRNSSGGTGGRGRSSSRPMGAARSRTCPSRSRRSSP